MSQDQKDKLAGRLDWEVACHDLPFVQDQHGELVSGPTDVAIERLLDQLDELGRVAYAGEEVHLRRAIALYAEGDDVSAWGCGFHAANIGNKPLFGGLGMDAEPEASLPLREALQDARTKRAANTLSAGSGDA